MSQFLRPLMIVLAILVSFGSNSSAEDELFAEPERWVPTGERQVLEIPDFVEPEAIANLDQDDAGPDSSPRELPTSEEILEPVETSPLEHVIEDVEDVLDGGIDGRPFNGSGWYSTPSWSSMMWRPGSGDRFGDFSLEGVSATPIEAWEGLSLTQGHGFHFLSGPTQTDMPARVFDFNMGLHWFGEISHRWWVDLAFSAGLYTDFEDSVREGWRFPSHAVVTWEYSTEIQPVVGLRYFDRDNLGLLPVAGVIVRPNDAIRIELVYPEPKIAWRVSTDADEERWLSLSGRIGGGEWAIERSDTDLADVVTYNDYQLVLAFSTVGNARSISSFELGYVFDRDLEYRSGQGNFKPTETFFIRLVTRK